MVVAWTTPDVCRGGRYYVYRSPSGAKGTWTQLNEHAPVEHGVSHWEDTEATLPIAGNTLYYRLLYVAPDGAEHDSPVIDMWNVLPREEYGLVRMSMLEEFNQMRLGGGIPVFHCIPLTSGVLAAHIDPASLQPLSAPCENDTSYGQIYQGGFAPPIQTWAKIEDIETKFEDRDDGLGFDAKHDVQLRLLAYPRPFVGHMIVEPRTDDRWVLGNPIKSFAHRGVVPTAYTAVAIKLDQNDPRYKLPMPEVTPVYPT